MEIKEIPIRETFQQDATRFEVYQSFQKPGKFNNATAVAVFAPHHKTTAMFLGLWDIEGCLKCSHFSEDISLLLKKHCLPSRWFDNSDMYQLKRNEIFDDLSERLIIEWGHGTLSWVQSKDKEIVAIKANKSIIDFQSFSLVDLNYQELKNIVQYPDSNLTWQKTLSSVNGIYLIRDKVSGKQYVGSAYGELGIYGRWSQYAQNGHGGNKELLKLDPENFQFSILEIVPPTTTADGVIDCENRWKEKLGTRKFGLNKN